MFAMIGDEYYIDVSKIVKIENIGHNEKAGGILYRITLRSGEKLEIEQFYFDDIWFLFLPS